MPAKTARPTTGHSSLADGRWRVHLEPYPDVTTDDLTLDDIGKAEEVCGIPWVLINPLASAKEAKAMLVLLLLRAGVAEEEALAVAGRTGLRQLATAFTFELPDRTQPAIPGAASETEADPPQ